MNVVKNNVVGVETVDVIKDVFVNQEEIHILMMIITMNVNMIEMMNLDVVVINLKKVSKSLLKKVSKIVIFLFIITF